MADDTAAIQAALDAVPASGGKVVFPSGTYRVSSTLTVGAANTAIEGAGRRQRIAALAATKIDYVGTGNVFSVKQQGLSLERVAVDYPAAPGAVVSALNVSDGFIGECHFKGSAQGCAIDINDGSGWRFYGTRVENFAIGMDLQQNNGHTVVFNCIFYDCNEAARIGHVANVMIMNKTGQTVDLGPGNVRVDVRKH